MTELKTRLEEIDGTLQFKNQKNLKLKTELKSYEDQVKEFDVQTGSIDEENQRLLTEIDGVSDEFFYDFLDEGWNWEVCYFKGGVWWA